MINAVFNPKFLFGRSRTKILMQILTFVDKKRAQKTINLAGLVFKMREALRKHALFALYYLNNYLLAFLNLLRKHGYIFNYYIVPGGLFKNFLKFGYKPVFYPKLVIVYFGGLVFGDRSLKKIQLISKPSRQIYFTYHNLRRLLALNTLSCLYILNTTKGLITHVEALQLQIGGNIVCVVY